jgi:hypothetical protein
MASGNVAMAARQDWILADPWPWTFLGLGLCLVNCAAVRFLGESLNGLGVTFVFLGLLAAGIGVAVRLNSSAPSFLDRSSPDLRIMVLSGLTGLFCLIAVAATTLLVLRLFEIFAVPFRVNSLIIVWVIVVPLSLAAVATCARRALSKSTITPAEEGAAVLALAALTAFSASWALYNPDSREDWDTLRLFLAVLFVVALLAAPLLLVTQAVRRLVVSLLIVLHFGGICTAALSAPPSPWIVQQIWQRVYQPYLEFMYLNNAYHFYAPEPGPASYLWFRMIFENPEGKQYAHWIKVPDVDDKGWHKYTVALEYQRMLAVTENVVPTDAAPNNIITLPDGTMAYADWYARRMERSQMQGQMQAKGERVIGKEAPQITGLIIPLHPAIALPNQFLLPNSGSRALLESYARHVCLKPHPKHPDWKVKGVKIYRVKHVIPDISTFVNETQDPRSPLIYQPYYMGHYDPDGKLLDGYEYDSKGRLTRAGDPFLYWLLPMLPELPNLRPEAPIISWAARHAGDPDDLYVYDKAEKRHVLKLNLPRP